MEQTNVSACKFILTTYEGGTNHYYDTTFNLKVPFKTNSNGVYKITLNEVMFKNNEATLLGGIDSYSITVHFIDAGGVLHAAEVKYTVKNDLFTYSRSTFGSSAYSDIIKIMKGDDKLLDITGNHYNGNDIIENIHYIDAEGGLDTTVAYTTQKCGIGVEFTDAFANAVKIYKVELSYTDNFGYVFNNMNLVLNGSAVTHRINGGDKIMYDFTFYNLRLMGPYLYVIDTPLHSTVNTYNANNQGYNIVALSYNTSDAHNSLIQMCSSMECTTNDLSNFRIRLLNDQYVTVKIFEPIYLQITVSNEG